MAFKNKGLFLVPFEIEWSNIAIENNKIRNSLKNKEWNFCCVAFNHFSYRSKISNPNIKQFWTVTLFSKKPLKFKLKNYNDLSHI